MSAGVEPSGERATAERGVAPDAALLERGLAIAARSRGLTFVAFPADVVAAPQLVDAWRDTPTVAWSAPDLTLVGVGIARELRARGAGRFEELAAALNRANVDHRISKLVGSETRQINLRDPDGNRVHVDFADHLAK